MWRRNLGLPPGVVPRLIAVDRRDVPDWRHPTDRRLKPVADTPKCPVAAHVTRNRDEARIPLHSLPRAHPRTESLTSVDLLFRLVRATA